MMRESSEFCYGKLQAISAFTSAAFNGEPMYQHRFFVEGKNYGEPNNPKTCFITYQFEGSILCHFTSELDKEGKIHFQLRWDSDPDCHTYVDLSKVPLQENHFGFPKYILNNPDGIDISREDLVHAFNVFKNGLIEAGFGRKELEFDTKLVKQFEMTYGRKQGHKAIVKYLEHECTLLQNDQKYITTFALDPHSPEQCQDLVDPEYAKGHLSYFGFSMGDWQYELEQDFDPLLSVLDHSTDIFVEGYLVHPHDLILVEETIRSTDSDFHIEFANKTEKCSIKLTIKSDFSHVFQKAEGAGCAGAVKPDHLR